jgi:hypothetical protein
MATRSRRATRWTSWAIGLVVLPTVATAAVAADDQPRADGVGRMSRQIDSRIEQRLDEAGMAPAEICGDSEFLRRVSLDLTGVIPTVSEVREFLADQRPDKRARRIERLLASPRHATHLAIAWRRIMLPTDFDPAQLDQAVGLQRWLRQQFVANLRYDRLVAEFLSSTGDQQTGPALFYRSLDAKPEKLAAATSRIFLGLQIQCAECHDHPFDQWTQRDFWGYAAFFAQLQPDRSMRGDAYRLVDLPTGEVTLPDSVEVVPPRFPRGDSPANDARGTRRRQLSIWMASRDNPYLAPAAVNRVWEQMFGRGLVHPVDDLGPHHQPSHPELFDELTQFFIDQGFDLRSLYRALANTKAYQRSSAGQVSESSEQPLYARMAVRRLTAEQLFDSLHRSLNLPGGAPGPDDPRRRQFVAQMETSSRDVTQYDLGIQQVLQLINGDPIAQSTASAQQGLLAALEAPFLDPRQQVEVLYLATLSRFPSDVERETCLQHVHAAAEGSQPLGDVLWALLNCAEYQFNH